MLAAISALAAILHAGALTFEIIRHAGVAYLLWTAWATLRDTGALQIDDSLPPRRRGDPCGGADEHPEPQLALTE